MNLNIIGRDKELFIEDLNKNNTKINEAVNSSSFLVLGGAGSIGQAVVKELFKRDPKKLHVVDISENNLVELTRDLRSTYGYIKGDFQTFALDISSWQYDQFIQEDGRYDYVLNFSALKHVRSEKDKFTLLRLIEVNIINTIKTIQQSKDKGVRKYFSVSTDKAANPANLMGASKRLMEMCMINASSKIEISSARFANVAFSDGSLLFGFNNRIDKAQPIVAPNDISRYFITASEAAKLCLFSCLLGKNGDIFYPKPSNQLRLITFSDIAINFLETKGYKPFLCKNEQEARVFNSKKGEENYWPCLFEPSNTTGEKPYEEFYTANDVLDEKRFSELGIITNKSINYSTKLDEFILNYDQLKLNKHLTVIDIAKWFEKAVPELIHLNTNKYLDSKM